MKSFQVGKSFVLDTYNAGVSNSNLSKEHIPKENAPRAADYKKKKLSMAVMYKKRSQNKLNLIEIYNFVTY
jgi:hypothetical protein